MILQEAQGNAGMQVRVPVLRAGTYDVGLGRPVRFTPQVIAEMAAAAQAQIREGKQPIGSYARSAYAKRGDRLPCGAAVAVEYDRDEECVYATLEVLPTDDGKNIQMLLSGRKLRSVNPRLSDVELMSGEGGDEVVSCRLLGVDWSPEGSALLAESIALSTTSGDLALVPGLHTVAAARAAGKAGADAGEGDDDERERKDRLTRPSDEELETEVSMDIDRFLDEANDAQIRKVRSHPRVRGRAVEQEIAAERSVHGLAIPGDAGIALEPASIEERIGALLQEGTRRVEQRVAAGGGPELAGGMAVPEW